MNELKRVFLDAKRLTLLCILLAFSICLFLVSLPVVPKYEWFKNEIIAAEYTRGLTEKCKDATNEEISAFLQNEYESLLKDNNDDINILKQEGVTELIHELEYVDSYNAYINGIKKQTEQNLKTNVFGKAGSFSKKNLEKTARDFDRLSFGEYSANSTNPKFAFSGNRGINRWLGYELSDYFMLLCVIIVVLSFFEERKNGLWNIVRCSKKGRINLALTRLGVLFWACVGLTGLFSGLNLLISMLIYGNYGDLDRAAQSIEALKSLTVPITLSRWFVWYFFTKILSNFILGLLVWCIAGSLTNIQFSTVVITVFFSIEYILYTLLPLQSSLHFLRYINVFSYVNTFSMFTEYFNINLFSIPVSYRPLLIYLGILGAILMSLYLICMQSRRYPEGNKDYLGKISLAKNKLLDFLRRRFRILGWELYKTLIYELVAFVIVISIVASTKLNYVSVIRENDIWYGQYLMELEGEIGENTKAYIEKAYDYADKSAFRDELYTSLNRIEKRINELENRAEENGYVAWLIDDKLYEAVYGNGLAKDFQRLNAVVSIIFLIFMCSAVFSYEHQTGVVYMVRSTKKGREALFNRKIAVAVFLSLVVWLVVYGREIYIFAKLYQKHSSTLGACVRNMDFLSGFPINVSIKEYLASLYAIRLFMLIMTSFVICFISTFSKTIKTSLFYSMSILGLPALFVFWGWEFLKYFSPITVISAQELMINIGHTGYFSCFSWICMSAIGLGSVYWGKKKWKRCD